MNIIFLDVDGVLNSKEKLIKVYNETHTAHSGYSYPFDENCLNNLQILINKTESKLVIISSWRKSKEGKRNLVKVLEEYKLDKEVIGYTPILNSPRSIEIKAYLNNCNLQRPNFIILDDESSDLGDLISYLVKTDSEVGLTSKNVEEAVIKLNRQSIISSDEISR